MAFVSQRKFVLPFSLAGLLTPGAALACSVCFVAGKDNLSAFFGTALLLSFLPFVLIGGLGLWFYRQHKARPKSLLS